MWKNVRPKTILQSRNNMFWLLFFHFYFGTYVLSNCGATLRPVYCKDHVGRCPLQYLIPDWSTVVWGGCFRFTLGCFGPKPNQMVLREKSCWNLAWLALHNVTWDFVLFFQAHLLEVDLVKIVRVQWFQKNLNCSFMIFISKETLCTPWKTILNIFFFLLLNFWKK
jgi:hypothetical protein